MVAYCDICVHIRALCGFTGIMHFCSLECLISWASSQIVNASKIDTGGPVVALSGEEYERRFGEKKDSQ